MSKIKCHVCGMILDPTSVNGSTKCPYCGADILVVKFSDAKNDEDEKSDKTPQD
jgi:uncharacterized Zn finger protein (UPF0148 family)